MLHIDKTFDVSWYYYVRIRVLCPILYEIMLDRSHSSWETGSAFCWSARIVGYTAAGFAGRVSVKPCWSLFQGVWYPTGAYYGWTALVSEVIYGESGAEKEGRRGEGVKEVWGAGLESGWVWMPCTLSLQHANMRYCKMQRKIKVVVFEKWRVSLWKSSHKATGEGEGECKIGRCGKQERLTTEKY